MNRSNTGFTSIEILMITTISLLIFGFIFYCLDNCLGTSRIDYGIVTNKHYEPAYTTTTITIVNKVSTPLTTYYPESYTVNIKLDSGSDSVSVSESLYHSMNIGDTVKVYCTIGRFSRTIYIKDIL